MECRQLGSSGLRVPVLSFGTGTFGGQGPLFSAWGQSDAIVAHQVYYSLIGRAYEWDLMPMAQSEGVGALVWSQLGWSLTAAQVATLDAASDVLPPYPHTPYRQQAGFARLNPPIVGAQS